MDKNAEVVKALKSLYCNTLILKSLAMGRELIRKPNTTLKWKDNMRYPSLANRETAPLFQQGLIAPEYKENVPHTSENLTGRIILTVQGKALVKKLFF